MLRLRTHQNKLVEIPRHCPFVEILDPQGKLAGLLYNSPDGRIEITMPTDESFHEYCAQFQLEACEQISLPGHERYNSKERA